MRILFVQKEGGIFGAETFQLNIIPQLLAHGTEVTFLRLYANHQGGAGGRFVALLRGFGVKVHEVNIGRYFSVTAMFKIHRAIREGNFDLVHAHLVHADLYLALIRIFLNRRLKFVSTKHGYDNAFTARFGFDARKQGITPYSLVVRLSESQSIGSYTISHGLRNFFIAARLASPQKMKMIHYGFDFEEPAATWESPDYKRFPHQLVIAGRLVAFKGHRYVIEALPEILQRHPDAGLVILGTGPMENELRNQCRRLNLESKVIFIGYTQEVRRWMFHSDIVLVPSVSEGFGVVFLEAFSCYKPVVAFDVPASNELIQHGDTGYLVPPFEVSKFAAAIDALLLNPREMTEVGKKANQKLKDYFSIRRMVKETEDFYRQIIESK